ncbi:MAG: hypothetical protein RMK30_04290 [Anaerolineae bacterium]|nr:hypothetical protein [Anaerolineae bacterium]
MCWAPMLVAAVLLRLILWWKDELPFHADEAVVALMARHILQGERPLFFYGQSYMGALDAYLTALGFALFGESVTVIRMVQALLYAGTMVFSAAWLYEVAGKSSQCPVLLLLLFPPVGFLLYTAFSLGGYGEALFFGSVLLWWTWRCSQRQRILLRDGFLWGSLAGIGLWCTHLTAIYVLPLTFILLYKQWRGLQVRWPFWAGLAAGLTIGLIPYLLHIGSKGVYTVLADLRGARVPQHPLLSDPLQRLGLLVLAWFTVVMGVRPPWEFIFIGGPLAVVPLLLFLLLVKVTRKPISSALTWPLVLAGFNLFLWWATPFAGDVSGRYALPSTHAWILFLAGSISQVSQRKLRAILLWGFTGYYALSLLILTWGPGFLNPQFNFASRIDLSGLPELAEFLERNRLVHGYTNYWIAYPLAFLSGEKLIFAPRLPYHFDLRYSPWDDRYPLYTCLVVRSEDIAYVTSGPPALDQALRKGFQALGITWEEVTVKNFRVYYRLSSPVHPWELGISSPPEPCP